MSEPLNPLLYRRLTMLFGDVAIKNAGQRLTGRFVPQGDRVQFQVIQDGETYAFNCPFCRRHGTSSDVRQRLWMNHRWGVGLQDGSVYASRPLWHLWHCFNSECQKVPECRNELRIQVYDSIMPQQRLEIPVRQGQSPAQQLFPTTNPGACIPLEQLPAIHKANQYLASRGFDPGYLSRQYRVTYCESPPPQFSLCRDRIIIPVFMRGIQVGWQARYIGAAPKGTPKYWTMPTMPKQLALYDYDHARSMPFVVITEGVTDVWAVSTGTVALLGKTMSSQQAELITHIWRGKAAVVLLDADATSYSQRIANTLSPNMAVVNVQLPRGTDPAEMDQAALWELILDTAASRGVDLLRAQGSENRV